MEFVVTSVFVDAERGVAHCAGLISIVSVEAGVWVDGNGDLYLTTRGAFPIARNLTAF